MGVHTTLLSQFSWYYIVLSKVDQHVMKKLPSNAKTSSVLVWEVDSLPHTVTAFVRLASGTLLGNLTKAPYQPDSSSYCLTNQLHYHEVGRFIATLMSYPVRNFIFCFGCRGNKFLLLGIPWCSIQGKMLWRSFSWHWWIAG